MNLDQYRVIADHLLRIDKSVTQLRVDQARTSEQIKGLPTRQHITNLIADHTASHHRSKPSVINPLTIYKLLCILFAAVATALGASAI